MTAAGGRGGGRRSRVFRRGRTMCLTKVTQQRRKVFHWLRATRSQSGGPQTIAPSATLNVILCDKAGDRAGERRGVGCGRRVWYRSTKTFSEKSSKQSVDPTSSAAPCSPLFVKIKASNKTEWDKLASRKTFRLTYPPALSISHSLLGCNVYQRQNGQNAQAPAEPSLLFIHYYGQLLQNILDQPPYSSSRKPFRARIGV